MMELDTTVDKVAGFTVDRLDIESKGWESGVAVNGLWKTNRFQKVALQATDRAIETQTSDGLLAFGWGDYPKEWMRRVDEDMSSYKPTINTSILGYGLIEGYKQTEEERYLQALHRLFEYYDQVAPRTSEGALIRRLDAPEIFTETIYFLSPLFIRYGSLINKEGPIEEAIFQVRAHLKRLQDPHSGLFRHIWCENPDSFPLSQFWSRSNGWAVAGLIDTILLMPDDHPARDYFVQEFRRAIDAIINLQDASGFWHIILDDTRSSLETSGTLIFAYGIKRGLNSGILSGPRYEEVATEAMRACKRVVTEKGAVNRVSKPPASAHSPLGVTLYGQGWFLLAAECFP